MEANHLYFLRAVCPPSLHVQILLVGRQVQPLTPSPHVQIDGVCSRACFLFPFFPSQFCSFPFEPFLLCLGDSFICQVLMCICSFPRANTLICDFCYDTADFCSLYSFFFFFILYPAIQEVVSVLWRSSVFLEKCVFPCLRAVPNCIQSKHPSLLVPV